MDILGLAILAGTEYLKKYSWAPTALEIIEEVLEKKPPVTLENKGTDLEAFIDSLPPETRAKIRKHRFDIQNELVLQQYEPRPTSKKTTPNKHKHVFSLLAIGGLLTILLLTVIAYGIVTWKTGEVPDMGFMMRLLDLLKSVAESYLSTV